MKSFILVALILLSSPVWAQQVQQSPSEIAVGIDNDVGILARIAEQQARVIQALQARVKALEDKYEPKDPAK